MIKRFLCIWCTVLAMTFCVLHTAHARRLKVYSLPKQIAPGQLGFIVFENPNPDQVKSEAKCSADKLIGWVKSDVPILRIEQNGKQVWTSLGSYETKGDSCIATFMAPLSMVPGAATLYLVNDHDASIPYAFSIISQMNVTLKGVEGTGITPLGQFRLIGEGFVPTHLVNSRPAIDELEANVGYSKLPKAEQWTVLNHRIINDWDKLDQGDFLYMEQNGKTWRTFVEQCGMTAGGLALDFIAPPDLKPGPVKLTLKLRVDGKEVAETAPFTASVL